MEKKKEIKVIGFDLDDTLYKERDFVKSGFRAVSRHVKNNYKINGKKFYNSLIKVLNDKGRGKIFNAVLKEYNIFSKELVKKLVDIYRQRNPKIKVYHGVKSLLKSLRKKYKIALITDGLSSVQRKKVKALKINNFFDTIVYTNDFKKNKLSSFPFKKVADSLKVKPKDMIYIGDDPNKDFIEAKKLGITTIKIKKGRFKDLNLKKDYQAEYEIENFKNIIKIIKDIEIL